MMGRWGPTPVTLIRTSILHYHLLRTVIWRRNRACYCPRGPGGLWSFRMFRTTVTPTRILGSPLVTSISENLTPQIETAFATGWLVLFIALPVNMEEEASVLLPSGPRWFMIVEDVQNHLDSDEKNTLAFGYIDLGKLGSSNRSSYCNTLCPSWEFL